MTAMFYNFDRIQQKRSSTPAIEAGVTGTSS
jgi:hypothetical protein